MPGSDTALTVDRTYSDPGRHQRCKSRVRGAGRVAVGAPGRGARPGGLRLPRELTLVPRVSLSAAPPSLLLGVRDSPPLSVLEGLGRGASEPGLRLGDPRSTAGVGRRAKAGPPTPHPRPPLSWSPRALPGRRSLPDGRALPPSPPGSARRAVPRRVGIPPPAAPCPRWDGLPLLISQPSGFRAPGRWRPSFPAPRGSCWRLCPSEKSVLALPLRSF